MHSCFVSRQLPAIPAIPAIPAMPTMPANREELRLKPSRKDQKNKGLFTVDNLLASNQC